MGKIKRKTLENKFLRVDPQLRWHVDKRDTMDGTSPATYSFVFTGSAPVIKKAYDQVVRELSKYTGPVEILDEDFGRVKGTNFGYEFYKLKSRTSDIMIKNLELDIPKIEDKNMYERIRKMYIRHDGVAISFSVENYVADLNNK